MPKQGVAPMAEKPTNQSSDVTVVDSQPTAVLAGEICRTTDGTRAVLGFQQRLEIANFQRAVDLPALVGGTMFLRVVLAPCALLRCDFFAIDLLVSPFRFSTFFWVGKCPRS
jgi:hypothetical protein